MSLVDWLATPLTNALMITAFVAVMMITVEYLSVLTRGAFQQALGRALAVGLAVAVGRAAA